MCDECATQEEVFRFIAPVGKQWTNETLSSRMPDTYAPSRRHHLGSAHCADSGPLPSSSYGKISGRLCAYFSACRVRRLTLAMLMQHNRRGDDNERRSIYYTDTRVCVYIFRRFFSQPFTFGECNTIYGNPMRLSLNVRRCTYFLVGKKADQIDNQTVNIHNM